MKRLASVAGACFVFMLAGCASHPASYYYEQSPTPAGRPTVQAPVVTPTPENARYILEFSGAGENATVTISGSAGMIQRHVTLPYSETMPYTPGQSLSTNVVKFGSSVGCKITVVSNTHPEGVVFAETPVVDGQTMAICRPTPR